MSWLSGILAKSAHLALALALAVQGFFGARVNFTAPAELPPAGVASETARFPTVPDQPPAAVPTTTPSRPDARTAAPNAAAPVSSPAAPEQTAAQVNDEARAALVNILCTTNAGGYLHPISGSGVIMDGAGIILTNAHVGQFFLLRDYPTQDNVDCVVRTGSPAAPTYRAVLLYLPPAWIQDNASQITAQEATGTGENDYAFLRITGTVNGAPLPASFPALSVTFDAPGRGQAVLLASYPAGFLEGATIEKNLYASSAFSTIGTVYSFSATGTADLISLGGTVVTQAGSSGGAVVRRQDGALLGIIATASAGTTTAARVLNAITLGHINRSLAAEGQGGLLQLLSGDLSQKAATFEAKTAPALRQALIDALTK